MSIIFIKLYAFNSSHTAGCTTLNIVSLLLDTILIIARFCRFFCKSKNILSIEPSDCRIVPRILSNTIYNPVSFLLKIEPIFLPLFIYMVWLIFDAGLLPKTVRYLFRLLNLETTVSVYFGMFLFTVILFHVNNFPDTIWCINLYTIICLNHNLAH